MFLCACFIGKFFTIYVFALNNAFGPEVYNIQYFTFKIWNGFRIDLFCLMEHIKYVYVLSLIVVMCFEQFVIAAVSC